MYHFISTRNDQLIEGIGKVNSACHDSYKNDIKDHLKFLATKRTLNFPDAIHKHCKENINQRSRGLFL